MVVIGSSWGGLSALGEILRTLPEGFMTPITVAQHRSDEGEERLLEDTLETNCLIPVVDVHSGQPIEPGNVYIAPPDYHLLVEPGHFSLSTDDLVEFARPSVDVLFESAADSYGRDLVGVILTGAGRDGAAGLKAIYDRGGHTIVQDPQTAERASMPEAAIALGAAREILPLRDIPARIVELCEAELAA